MCSPGKIRFMVVEHIEDIDKSRINIGDMILVHEVITPTHVLHNIIYTCVDINEETNVVTLYPNK